MQKSSCEYNSSLSVARIAGSKSVSAGNETLLQLAVAKMGPVSVAVDASSRTFQVHHTHIALLTHYCTISLQFYYRGIYSSQRCSSSRLNHAMLVTGYGTINQRDYWLAKNRYGVRQLMRGPL